MHKRYVDGQNLAARSIGRGMKFCQVTGMMVKKTDVEIEAEKDLREDELYMEEKKC